jgi:hypothetical protein
LEEGSGDLRGHEGKFVVHAALDDFGVNNESGGDVVLRIVSHRKRESMVVYSLRRIRQASAER